MRLALKLFVALVLSACQPQEERDLAFADPSSDSILYAQLLPKHFPWPDIPEDNFPTAARVNLGKALFFDVNLSEDKSISCASCHLPAYAFTDTAALSSGVFGRKGFRNSISLVNVAYQKSLFRDGGVPSLETQILAPLDHHDEMNLDMKDVIDYLNAQPGYVSQFESAYHRLPDVYSFTRAIAAFERTLIFGNSAYDRWINGDSSALTTEQIAGYEAFMSDKAKCASCHSGFNFDLQEFKANGSGYTEIDPGRARVTLASSDRGKFKVPSLRNVAITAPYMHDGSLKTLDQVLEHYHSLADNNNPKEAELANGLQLNEQEKQHILAFLSALTDEAFLK